MSYKGNISKLKYHLLVDYRSIDWLNRWLRPSNIATLLLTRYRIK